MPLYSVLALHDFGRQVLQSYDSVAVQHDAPAQHYATTASGKAKWVRRFEFNTQPSQWLRKRKKGIAFVGEIFASKITA